MPLPIGRDRLDAGEKGTVVLTCAAPKTGWRGRSPATRTSAEHPGTAVRWGDGFFEVVEANAHGAGARYVLAPWDERHAMRVVQSYDEAGEAAREEEQRDVARRSDRHVLLWLVAPVVGSLPGHVQESFEREYNVPARLLSLCSALPLWIAGWVAVILLLAGAMGAPSLPRPILLFGVYLLAESTARLVVAFLQGRPIGTLVGTLVHEVARRLGRGAARAAGRPVSEEASVFDVATEADQDVLDRYHVLEPALGLLPESDQAVLAERFDFDRVKWGRVSAIFLLVMFGPFALTCLLGALVVFEPIDLLKIAVFGGIVLEQVRRLARLRAARTAPSVFGVLVRPLARPLLG